MIHVNSETPSENADHLKERAKEVPRTCVPRSPRSKDTRKPDPKVKLLSSPLPSLTPDGKRPADGNSYASRGPFARYCVGSIKCSYGVPGNMTYG